MTLPGAAIAAHSLLAGDLGIRNVMLASVPERTRETGNRLAIGATLARPVRYASLEREGQAMNTILIVVVLILLFGGGGYYWNSRRG